MQAWDIFRQKYGTRLDQSQVINWVWYDTQLYTSAVTTQLTFFNAIRATRDAGNMEVAGVLAHPKAFIVRAIRVQIESQLTEVAAVPGAANDIARLIYNGFATFEIGNKNYGVWPLSALPSGAGVYAATGGAGAEATNQFQTHAGHGMPDPRAIYTLSQPLLIDPQINFQFQLGWAAAQTLSGNPNIKVMMDGELMRPVQ
ncbi:MAG: hypothetical protein ACREI9_04595 [Nitrospiraceae bacterium]